MDVMIVVAVAVFVSFGLGWSARGRHERGRRRTADQDRRVHRVHRGQERVVDAVQRGWVQ